MSHKANPNQRFCADCYDCTFCSKVSSGCLNFLIRAWRLHIMLWFMTCLSWGSPFSHDIPELNAVLPVARSLKCDSRYDWLSVFEISWLWALWRVQGYGQLQYFHWLQELWQKCIKEQCRLRLGSSFCQQSWQRTTVYRINPNQRPCSNIKHPPPFFIENYVIWTCIYSMR